MPSSPRGGSRVTFRVPSTEAAPPDCGMVAMPATMHHANSYRHGTYTIRPCPARTRGIVTMRSEHHRHARQADVHILPAESDRDVLLGTSGTSAADLPILCQALIFWSGIGAGDIACTRSGLAEGPYRGRGQYADGCMRDAHYVRIESYSNSTTEPSECPIRTRPPRVMTFSARLSASALTAGSSR